MANRQCFSLRRVFLTIRSDIALQRSSINIILATSAALLLLVNFIAPGNILQVDANPSFFIFLLFFGGIWLSSIAFRNLHKAPQSYFFILLPCSNLEKFIARWIETSIGYALAILIFYSIFYWIIAGIALVLTHNSYFIKLPFLASTWHLIINYIVLQSIFFLGSIYFKKNAFIKTVFTLACIALFFIIIAGIISNSLLQHSPVYFFDIVVNNIHTPSVFFAIFNLVLAPICLLATYLRLCELEA